MPTKLMQVGIKNKADKFISLIFILLVLAS